MENIEKQLRSYEQSQYEREVNWVENGVIHYRSIGRGDSEKSKAAKKFLTRCFEPLVQAIREEQERVEKAKDRRDKYMLPLLSLPAEKLAFITIQGVCHNIGYVGGEDDDIGEGSGGAKEALVAREIGHRCWLERRLDLAESRERKVLDNIKPYCTKSSFRSVKKRLQELDKKTWSETNVDIFLGAFLLELAEEKRFIRRKLKKVRGKKVYYLELNTTVEHLLEAIVVGNEKLLEPLYSPMIEPPLPWTGLSDGGYLTNKKTHAIELVKHKTWNKNQILGSFQKVELTKVPAAVNALQRTPWHVNDSVYQVLREMMLERQKEVPGLDPIERLPALPKWYPDVARLLGRFNKKLKFPLRLPRSHPDYLKWEENGKLIVDTNRKISVLRKILLPSYNRVKTARELIKSRNQKTKRYRNIIIPMRINACEELIGKEFYFPYQLDFRGRAYPIPQVFNPQSDDMGRALIKFAIGKKLGSKGEYWFKVHLANTYGKDKESFDDRVAWVNKNERYFPKTPKEALKTTWWWTAEKPWRFLAACFEWAKDRDDPKNFKSYLPIAMDGTCNGLQHLSAIGRDKEGGRATNLSGNKPEDIYQQVADKLFSQVQDDYRNGKPEAAIDWYKRREKFLKNGKIDRKIAKQATMATPYGVTQYGIAKALRLEGFAEGLEDPGEGSKYLAKKLDKDAIPAVVEKAIEIKKWLQDEVVGVLGHKKYNRGCFWRTPTDLRIVQEYREPKKTEVRIGKRGRRFTIYREDPKGKVNVKKQKQQIVANFVHSMDAAHMMLTVNELHKKGLQSFAMIHDSYGVHACDVTLMRRILREQFVRIYKQPILKRFFKELCKANPNIKLEYPPSQGKLKIEKVLKSKYFFC